MQMASELIEELKILMRDHGDLPIVNEDGDEVNIEYNDDEEQIVYVVS